MYQRFGAYYLYEKPILFINLPIFCAQIILSGIYHVNMLILINKIAIKKYQRLVKGFAPMIGKDG
ncbi:MAG: hypothetical protein EBQ96_03610 [Proteobacteria bacterium]|nr:hypothetical protein [Pseudomonadota bacterium]